MSYTSTEGCHTFTPEMRRYRTSKIVPVIAKSPSRTRPNSKYGRRRFASNAYAHERRVVVEVPTIEAPRIREVIAFPCEELLVIPLRAGLRDARHLVQERFDGSRGADHLVDRQIVGPVAVAEEAREVVAPLDEPCEDIEIRGVAAVEIFLHQVPSDLGFSGISEDRDGIRVVRRDRDRAVGSGCVGLHEVRGKPIEVRRSIDADRPDVLADVLVEVLPDRRD